MSDGIRGISSGGGDEVTEKSPEDLEELSRLLSGISDEERIRQIIDRGISLSGIEITQRGQDIDREEQELVDQASREERRQQTLEQRLQELGDDLDDTELLREVVGRLSATNDNLSDLVSGLSSFRTDFRDTNRLIFKDTGTNTLEEAGREQDLVDESDIVTFAVRVKANAENDGILFIGDENVSPGDGYAIEPGAREVIPADASRQQIKIVSEEPDERYSYIALGSEI